MGVFNSSLWLIKEEKFVKLFNNHLYVILDIKQEEKAAVIELANSHNLSLLYPELFLNNTGDLSLICINDEFLGGHLSSISFDHEISYLKTKNIRFFKNVKELEKYVKTADQRQDHYFIKETNIKSYCNYLKSLSIDVLKDEYFLVKHIVDYTDLCYLAIKDYIEKTLSNSIKQSILKKENTLDAVCKHLDKIVNLKNKIDDVVNTNIYLINKDNCCKKTDLVMNSNDDCVLQTRMKAYLKRTHSYFHSCERSGYFYLNVIKENLGTILNLFYYKLVLEGTNSYKDEAFDNVRKLGYLEQLPDYLVGEKIGKQWDYFSVLQRLVYTLKIFDCYPLLSNDLIPLAFKTSEEVETLAKKLISLNYIDKDDLINCSKRDYPPVAVIIEPNKKIFRSSGGITVMASMCSSRGRKPLYISDLLEHFNKIIIDHDFVYHNLLLLKITSDKNRFDPQILSLKEAEKIKNNVEVKKLVDMVKEALRVQKKR